MKPVDRTVAFIQERYASEGLEVTGHDSAEGCVWVALPAEVTNFSELLDELAAMTDASCDIKLTESGAQLTVWVATAWPAVAPSPTGMWWRTAASVALLAVATAAGAFLFASPSSNAAREGAPPLPPPPPPV